MRSSDVVDVVATVPSLAVVVPRPPASRVPSSTSATSFEPFDAFARARVAVVHVRRAHGGE